MWGIPVAFFNNTRKGGYLCKSSRRSFWDMSAIFWNLQQELLHEWPPFPVLTLFKYETFWKTKAIPFRRRSTWNEPFRGPTDSDSESEGELEVFTTRNPRTRNQSSSGALQGPETRNLRSRNESSRSASGAKRWQMNDQSYPWLCTFNVIVLYNN